MQAMVIYKPNYNLRRYRLENPDLRRSVTADATQPQANGKKKANGPERGGRGEFIYVVGGVI